MTNVAPSLELPIERKTDKEEDKNDEADYVKKVMNSNNHRAVVGCLVLSYLTH